MRLTKAVVLEWLRRHRACAESTNRFIRARSVRQAWRTVSKFDAEWVLYRLGVTPESFCPCPGCDNWTKAQIHRQWPFELIEALILEEMAEPEPVIGGLS